MAKAQRHPVVQQAVRLVELLAVERLAVGRLVERLAVRRLAVRRLAQQRLVVFPSPQSLVSPLAWQR